MDKTDTSNHEVVFTEEVREILRYKSNESVLRLVRAGRLKPLSKSKPYRFSQTELKRFLQGK